MPRSGIGSTRGFRVHQIALGSSELAKSSLKLCGWSFYVSYVDSMKPSQLEGCKLSKPGLI